MDVTQQIALLNLGAPTWNAWRQAERSSRPDLSTVDIVGKDLRGIDLSNTNLREANMTRSHLGGADLRGAALAWADLTDTDLSFANLDGADLRHATLYRARLQSATLRQADLTDANLTEASAGADFSGATLVRAKLIETDLVAADLHEAVMSAADLSGARLLHTNLARADLSGAFVYGAAVWDVDLRDAKQTDLVVSHDPRLTVDDLEIAQLVYLLLKRERMRNVLETLTAKVVLILGRFTPDRKVILDAIAAEVRSRNLLPIIFDFDRATDRDFTETIKVLSGLSLFVIADITKPRSVAQELTASIPDYQIPFVPILQRDEAAFSMISDFKKYDWFLTPILTYASREDLLRHFKGAVLDRAWRKHLELRRKKSMELEIQSIDQFS